MLYRPTMLQFNNSTTLHRHQLAATKFREILFLVADTCDRVLNVHIGFDKEAKVTMHVM